MGDGWGEETMKTVMSDHVSGERRLKRVGSELNKTDSLSVVKAHLPEISGRGVSREEYRRRQMPWVRRADPAARAEASQRGRSRRVDTTGAMCLSAVL